MYSNPHPHPNPNPHQVLNAKAESAQREAEIISQARSHEIAASPPPSPAA